MIRGALFAAAFALIASQPARAETPDFSWLEGCWTSVDGQKSVRWSHDSERGGWRGDISLAWRECRDHPYHPRCMYEIGPEAEGVWLFTDAAGDHILTYSLIEQSGQSATFAAMSGNPLRRPPPYTLSLSVENEELSILVDGPTDRTLFQGVRASCGEAG